MHKYVLLALIALLPQALFAAELETPHYRVAIVEHCPEGEVSCQDVTYVGTNKVTGSSIRLKGKAVSRLCADGVTPCQHLGYAFSRGSYQYFVGDNGSLIVTHRGRQILSETGSWRW